MREAKSTDPTTNEAKKVNQTVRWRIVLILSAPRVVYGTSFESHYLN